MILQTDCAVGSDLVMGGWDQCGDFQNAYTCCSDFLRSHLMSTLSLEKSALKIKKSSG